MSVMVVNYQLLRVKALLWVIGIHYFRDVTRIRVSQVENCSRVCHCGPGKQGLSCMDIPPTWHLAASQEMGVARQGLLDL